jgi:hypothetical protein
MTNNKLLELARNQNYQEVINSYQQYPIETVIEVADFLREKDVYNVALSLYYYLLKQQEASDYHFGIGQCYGKTYQYSLALWHLDRAFSLQPTRLEANYYAYILERNLQMKLANQWYKEAINNGYEQDLWTLSHYAYFLLDTEYEQYLGSLDYDHAPFPFQVLVDLLDYFWRYLLPGKSDVQKVQAYEHKASQLQDSIHRDFDDLNKVLLSQNGDLTEWQRLTKLLLL